MGIKGTDRHRENTSEIGEIRSLTKNLPAIYKAAGFCVLVFCVLFIFNLFKFNISAGGSDSDIKASEKLVTEMQSGSVEDIESRVKALDDADGSSSSTVNGVKAKYMRKFKDCVVVGDSLTEGLSVYGFLSSGQVFSKIGASVVYGDDLFDGAAALKPKCAFFAFGMNDMGNYSGDEKAFIKRYSELLDRFMKASPNTKVYVCSISTPDKAAISRNSSIGNYKKFNAAIKAMCEKKKIPYIDDAYILADDPSLYAGDGIHAQPAYYPIWLDKMAEAAGL